MSEGNSIMYGSDTGGSNKVNSTRRLMYSAGDYMTSQNMQN